MTILDDHEVKHRLRGIHLVSQMMNLAPRDVVRVTGVGDLIYNVII